MPTRIEVLPCDLWREADVIVVDDLGVGPLAPLTDLDRWVHLRAAFWRAICRASRS